jgi:acyl carrier protein
VRTRDQTMSKLTEFVSTELLGQDESAELKPDSRLLEWGVLNSMNTARLLTYIRDGLGVFVSPLYITGQHFQTLDSITDLVQSLDSQAA